MLGFGGGSSGGGFRGGSNDSFWDKLKKGLAFSLGTFQVTPNSSQSAKRINSWNSQARNNAYKALNKKSNKTAKDIEDTNVSIGSGNNDDLWGALGGSGGGSSYGGGGTTKIDLQPMIDAYNQAAASQRNDVETSITNSKNALLDSLKRFQEDTDKARKQQTSSYNSARADLEESNFMNDRSAMQSASARGLGGSGLQQLAQLQNQIAAGKETSNLANANIEAQNELTTALQRQEQDTTKGVNELEKTRQNQLEQIDANLASNIANLQYNEQVRQAEAAAQAAAQAASLAASRNAQSSELMQLLQAGINDANAIKTKGLQAIQDAYNSSNNQSKRNKAVKQAYRDYQNLLNESYTNYILPNSYQDQFNNLLSSYYNNYYNH